MDKGLFIFIAVGLGFFYVITNFVGDIQEEDDIFQNTEYEQKHKFDQYQSVDSIGQEILTVTELDTNMQIVAWQESKLKEEFLSLFPNYEEMKIFVKVFHPKSQDNFQKNLIIL